MNSKPKQIEAKIIGEKGCYFLSIINGCCRYLNEEVVDIISLYELATEKGWVGNDCFVERPDLIASWIIGKKVYVTKQPLSYEPKDNEIEITRYERESTGVTFAHFVETRDGKVIYDPYGNSNTVAKGYPVSKRILTVNE